MNSKTILTIDDYISGFPDEMKTILQKIRSVIKQEAPEAEETIKYGMPTFELYGNLVHFAAMKHHIGFYPAPSGINGFKEQLAVYKTSKGAIQFPLGQAVPFDLIRAIVVFRIAENREKALLKQRMGKTTHSEKEDKKKI